MKKNVLRNNSFFVFALITGIFIFTRCTESEELNVEKQSDVILTDLEIDYIGKSHNDYLTKIFANFDWSNPTNEELIQQYNQLHFVKNELKCTYSSSYIDEKCSFSKNLDKLQTALSHDGYQLFSEALNLCTEMKTFEEIIKDIEAFEAKNELNNLPNYEKTAILVACSVWKNSAKYWMSSKENGPIILKNKSMSLLKARDEPEDPEKLTKLERVLAADGISAGIGMLGVAVAGACGPIGWVALAIVGGESALASGVEALR